MNNLQAAADRVEIEALRGEASDAVMTHDYDRYASLFTEDAVVRIPVVNVEYFGRAEIRAGIEQLHGAWDYFVKTAHPGMIELTGDAAVGRAYVAQFGRFTNGGSHLNYSVYHDRYQLTADEPLPETPHPHPPAQSKQHAQQPTAYHAGTHSSSPATPHIRVLRRSLEPKRPGGVPPCQPTGEG